MMSPEHVEIVKTMWLQRATSGEIVRHFNGAFTRSQVLGQIYRAGLMRTQKPRNAKSRKQQAREATMLRQVKRPDGLPFAKPIPMPTPTNAARRSFNCTSGPSYDLCDLTMWDCHWPLGDPLEPGFAYCAAPVLRMGPYCYHHSKTAYTQR